MRSETADFVPRPLPPRPGATQVGSPFFARHREAPFRVLPLDALHRVPEITIQQMEPCVRLIPNREPFGQREPSIAGPLPGVRGVESQCGQKVNPLTRLPFPTTNGRRRSLVNPELFAVGFREMPHVLGCLVERHLLIAAADLRVMVSGAQAL